MAQINESQTNELHKYENKTEATQAVGTIVTYHTE